MLCEIGLGGAMDEAVSAAYKPKPVAGLGSLINE